MSITVTRSAGSGSDSSSSGSVAWSNPSNVGTATPATVSLNAGQSSHMLMATNFGFSLPFGAKVLGVEFGMDVEASLLGIIREKQLLRVIDNTVEAALGNFGLVTWLVDAATAVLGGPNQLYGLEWDSQVINSSGFGVAVQCENIGLLASTGRVSNLYAKITYEPPVIRGVFGGVV